LAPPQVCKPPTLIRASETPASQAELHFAHPHKRSSTAYREDAEVGITEEARSVSAAQEEARRLGYILFVHRTSGREPLTHRATVAPAGLVSKGELGGYGHSALEAARVGLAKVLELAGG
jgi:hypothetical protein